MNEHARNAIVGVTCIGGIIFLAYLIVIFGDLPFWSTETYAIKIQMDNAAGVNIGTRISLNGVDIGSVDKVELKRPMHEGVIVHCQIDRTYLIPQQSLVTSSAGLIGGAAHLSITPLPLEAEESETYIATDGTAVLEGMSSGITDQIGQLADELRKNLHEPLSKFTEMADSIATLAKQYEQLGNNLTEMTNATDLQAVDAGDQQANIRTIVLRADAGMRDLQKAIDSINVLVGEEMQAELQKTLKGASDFTTDAQALTKEVRGKLDELTSQVAMVTDELSVTLKTTNALLKQVADGKGTAGRFVNDPALYNSLTDAADQLNDTLKEARLLIQKWKAEGLPVKL